jgi:iron complex outermembrane receptor protein
LIALALLAGAQAQEAAEEAAAAETAAEPEPAGTPRPLKDIEEIVVTAERREQAIADIPVSVTAITAEQRENLGITTIQDLANFTPGFTYGPGDRPSIRGVGRLSNNLSVDNAIATYADGAWTNSVAEAGKDAIFVERSEILRGPQGTLYGRNSIGGAINVISKRPLRDAWEIEGRAMIYNHSGRTLQAAASGPITDTLRFRVAASYPVNDGFAYNLANDRERGELDLWYAEGQLEWDILENLQLWGVYRTTRWQDGGGAPPGSLGFSGPFSRGEYVTGLQYGIGAIGPAAGFGFAQPGYTQVGDVTSNPSVSKEYTVNQNTKPTRRLDDTNIAGLHLDWTSDSFGIHYVFGFQEYVYHQRTDFDTTPVTSYPNPVGSIFETSTTIFPTYELEYTEDKQWWSHEITVSSEGDGALQWIAGVYYFHDEFFQPLSIDMPDQPQIETPTFNFFCGFVTTPTCLGGFGFPYNPAPAAAPVNSERSIFYADQRADNDSWAVFGQIDYDLTDQWQLTGGLRYTRDEKDVTEATRLICYGNLSFGCTPLNGVPILGYASQANDVTTIFRPGSGVGAPGVQSDPVTDPVTGLRSRELGDTWTAWTGTAGVQYRPREDALVYLRYSRGYKAGGLNAGNINPDPAADEETMDALELGWKQTFSDTLQLYSTAFHYMWHDMQVPLTVVQIGASREDLINLAEVDISGVEFELQWAPVENLFLLGSYAYLNTKIQDGCCFTSPVDPEALLPGASRVDFDPASGSWSQDLADNELPQSPDHRVTLNASYTLDFDPGPLILSATYAWRDEVFNDIFATQPAIAKEWGQLDLRATWRSADDDWTLIAFARNVLDERIWTAGGATRVATGPGGTGAFLVGGPARIDSSFNIGAPRTYGVEIHYRFRIKRDG